MRPAIQSAYSKIRFHKYPFALVYINRHIRSNLLWLADNLERSRGIFILQSTVWSAAEADLTIFCDACLSGMAFWLPHLCKAFVAQTSPSSLSIDDTIFWFETLTVLSALEWVALSSLCIKRVVIFTDNLNTVQMFDSLRSHPPYDLILLRAISLLISHSIDLRVWHIPGSQNFIADALSRGLFSLAHQHLPALIISTFQPPRIMLGVLQL